MRHVFAWFLEIMIVLLCASCGNSSTPSQGTGSPTPLPSAIIGWPFAPLEGAWTIVNGYNGGDHATIVGTKYAFDFGLCLDGMVVSATGTCTLTQGWDQNATNNQTVFSPVDGTIYYIYDGGQPDQSPCRTIGIKLRNYPTDYIQLAHIRLFSRPQQLIRVGDQVQQGEPLGTVTALSGAGCVGQSSHIHMALYSVCASCADTDRTPIPFTGMWNIGGCSFGKTQISYDGTLVPCADSGQQMLNPLWHVQIGGHVGAVSTIVDGVLYVGTSNDYVYAISAANGGVLWKTQVTASVGYAPVAANGLVFVSGGEYLSALDAKTGQTRWSQEIGAIVASYPSTPTVANGMVYVGSQDDGGYTWAYDASTGKLLWQFQGGDNPTAVGNIVYTSGVSSLPDYKVYVYALNATDGKVQWRTLIGDPVSETVDDPLTVTQDGVYFGNQDVFALNIADGSIRWQAPTGGSTTTSPVVDNGTVFFGTESETLVALNAGTGNQLWQISLGVKWYHVYPIVDNGVVYLNTGFGPLFAIDEMTGKQLWEYNAPSTLMSLQVVNNVIYGGSLDGIVYAVRTP